ncbi:MAG: hypothetical protein JWP29_5415 [Rhodoferax sp.]|nr:hypothetical protein [Rhodoferax sp.]
MTRTDIRALKRLVMAGLQHDASAGERQAARDAALQLLQRSIAMQHDRLFLHRLADAMKLGAAIDPRARAHCEAMAGDPIRFGGLFAAARKIHPSLPCSCRT